MISDDMADQALKMDVWNEFQSERQCVIPLYIINIFKLNGFDEINTISKIEQSDIDTMEEFARNEMFQFISPSAATEDFYGIYGRSEELQKKFKFLPGHTKLIYDFVKFCRAKADNSNNSDGCAMKKFLKKKIKDAQNIDPSSHAVQQVTKLINQYVNGIDLQFQTFFRENIKNFNAVLDNDNEVVKVICDMCKKSINLNPRYYKNGEKTWIISNFIRHLTRHFNENESNGNSLGKSRAKQHKLEDFLIKDNQLTNHESLPPGYQIVEIEEIEDAEEVTEESMVENTESLEINEIEDSHDNINLLEKYEVLDFSVESTENLSLYSGE